MTRLQNKPKKTWSTAYDDAAGQATDTTLTSPGTSAA